ncbi:Large ribosomal subunit protein uL16 OS=Lysinibacillus sphaericus CBAM5 OX=1400869 GN=rplP PE=3 SV=1 [Lysinibacillus sphaericus]
MLCLKRVKYRREHRGNMRGEAKGGKEVYSGRMGLASSNCWIT